jgi:hypothetical protein
MKFSEVARRLTGISCPIFGVSWNPGSLLSNNSTEEGRPLHAALQIGPDLADPRQVGRCRTEQLDRGRRANLHADPELFWHGAFWLVSAVGAAGVCDRRSPGPL